MWIRRWLARLLSMLDDRPIGALSPGHFRIDDGVDYSLPLPISIPDGADAETLAAIRQSALSEASAEFHFQFDRPYTSRENLSLFPTADPLREWDYGGDNSTRTEILKRTHLAYERNPLANAAVRMTTLFAVGQGMTVTYYNEQVKEILEEFRAHPENGIEEYEKSFCNDIQVDGELFIRFYAGEDGQTLIVPLKPWEVWWIKHERGHPKRVESYHVVQNLTDGTPGDFEQVTDDIPVSEIVHVTLNKHSYELRGRPELFRLLPWLKAYKDWLENRARQNHWRDAVIWFLQLAGATPSQVASFRAQFRQPPPPGSILVGNDKMDLKAVQNKSSASDVAEDGRQIKLMTAVGANLPEYMLSDGQNANLASATAQQLPALRKFVDFQDIMIYQVWLPIYRRVVENAIAVGRLPEVIGEEDQDGEPVRDEPKTEETPLPAIAKPRQGRRKTMKAIEAFSISAPELESDDPKTLADALAIAVTRGWVSNETASGQMGFDYRAEQKKIKREDAADANRAVQGFGGNGFAPASVIQTPKPNGNEPEEETTQESEAIPPLTRPPVNMTFNVPDEVRLITFRAPTPEDDEAMRAMGSGMDAIAGDVKRLGETLSEMAQLADRRDAGRLSAIREMMDSLEARSELPAPVITVDESLLARVAQQAATLASEQVSTYLDTRLTASEVVSQDVAERDALGRALIIQRILASGRTVNYRVVRDDNGNISSLNKEG